MSFPCFFDTVCAFFAAFRPYACQFLHTSTQAVYPEQRSSSGKVSSMALLLLPQAGKTVSKRLSDSSR